MNITAWIRKAAWFTVLMPCLLKAEFLDLATMPLQTSGSSDVLPNLMFVLDNSGSMGWNYTPDWVTYDPDDNRYDASDWLFSNSAFNTQFYNPSVIYTPPMDYKGASLASQTSYAATSERADTMFGRVYRGTSAYYYAYVPGEYCTTPNLTSCVVSKTETGAYKYPSTLRWCNTSTAANNRVMGTNDRCQAIRNDVTSINDSNTYRFLREPKARYQLTLTRSSGTVTVSSIKINNIELMSASTSATSSNSLASNVASRICTSSITGNCQIANNTVTTSANVITITTFAGDPVDPANPIQVTLSGSGSFSAQRLTANSSDIPGSLVYQAIVSGKTYTAPGSTVKAIDRTDCAGSTCTYNEELANYANWSKYYSTRILAMKTAASQAFQALDARYRVGFVTINNSSSNYLPIAPFNAAQKQSWYNTLFAVSPTGSTPLRTALSSVGRHFAGKKTLGTDDPMQYACQQNFTLMTTDGYWNDDSSTPRRVDGSTAIGDLDGSAPRPQYDKLAKANTLADVAKYFYDTDLRDGSFSNCNGALGSSVCGTATDYPKQNMVTLTLGLGIDGTLAYTDDYDTQVIGDFSDIKAGNKFWDDPISKTSGQRIDDLWHAAVNAGGTYYSASNPKLLRESLSKGLSEIKSVQGASAAAAASSLAPTSGDNFQYVASYQTVKWIGNLEARTVNLQSLETSQGAVWCVENVAATTCAAPAVEFRLSGNGSTTLYCKTANSSDTACGNAGGILGSVLGTSELSSCYVEIPQSCDGRLQKQTSRNIFFNLNGSLVNFNIDNLPAQHVTALNTGYLALSQMQGLPASDPKISDANKVGKLVDYLRGSKTYEDISLNTVAANRLFRGRQAILGDISQSRPSYFKVSNAGYLDANYTAYKTTSASRVAAVYVGANDGMLHAFNANTGDELWAFIPTPVIPKLANLADKEYGASYHTNYVNGSPVVTDVCVSACGTSGAVWRTILVSGLNGGGRGYFALDVTNPSAPVLLWEFYAQNSGTLNNIGYSYGNPLVTKMLDGRWVVVLSSGYNNGTYVSKLADGSFVTNTPVGDGGGYLYVLDANTGSLLKTLSTGEGTAAAPSGLAKISGYAEQMFENNTALKIYGGDLNGNVWRFDINTGAVTKIATLLENGGAVQKITTQPELGKIDSNIVVMVGTGKFLEPADLTNTPQNSVYTIKDNNQTTPVTRSQLVSQTLTADRRVTSAATVNFNSGYGWFLDFPAGERVNLDPLLLQGVLLMPTTVPTSAACSGAGYGWFNFIDYRKGGSPLASGLMSERMLTPAVGYNIVYDNKGVPHVVVTGSNDPTPQQLSLDDQVFGLSSSGTISEIFKQKSNGSYGTKQSWHELIQ